MPVALPPLGIHCPLCWSKKYRSVGRKSPTRGARVVYYRCNSCINPKTGRPTRFKMQCKLAGVTGPKEKMLTPL